MRKNSLAKSIAALSLLCGIGGLALFVGFPLGKIGVVRPHWSGAAVLWWAMKG